MESVLQNPTTSFGKKKKNKLQKFLASAWTFQNTLPTVSAVTSVTSKYIQVHFALHLKTKNTSENLKRPNTKLREVFSSFKSSNYKMCATVITSMSKLLNSFHKEQYLMEMIFGAFPLLN